MIFALHSIHFRVSLALVFVASHLFQCYLGLIRSIGHLLFDHTLWLFDLLNAQMRTVYESLFFFLFFLLLFCLVCFWRFGLFCFVLFGSSFLLAWSVLFWFCLVPLFRLTLHTFSLFLHLAHPLGLRFSALYVGLYFILYFLLIS